MKFLQHLSGGAVRLRLSKQTSNYSVAIRVSPFCHPACERHGKSFATRLHRANGGRRGGGLVAVRAARRVACGRRHGGRTASTARARGRALIRLAHCPSASSPPFSRSPEAHSERVRSTDAPESDSYYDFCRPLYSCLASSPQTVPREHTAAARLHSPLSFLTRFSQTARIDFLFSNNYLCTHLASSHIQFPPLYKLYYYLQTVAESTHFFIPFPTY